MSNRRYSIQLYAFVLLFSISSKAQMRRIDIYGSSVNQRFSSDTVATNNEPGNATFIKKEPEVAVPKMRKNEYYFYEEKPSGTVFYPPLKQIQITSHFGYRNHPVTGGIKFHSGIDLKACYEPVYAVAGGIIEKCEYNEISGNYIIINHGNVKTIYCHLSKSLLKKNDLVTGGDVIGITGNTGRSTGPHLHFAVKYLDRNVDPRLLFFIFRPDLVR